MVGYTTTVLSTSYYVTPAVYEPPMQAANNICIMLLLHNDINVKAIRSKYGLKSVL